MIAAGASTPAAETPVALAAASRTADTPTLPTAPAATTETPVAVATLPTVATATSHATEATPQPAQLARQRTTVTTTLAQPTAATAPEPPTQAAATATTAIIGINGTPAANNPIALATATQAAEAPTLPEAPAAPIETPAAAITRLATGAEPRPAAEPTTAAAVPIRRLLPTLPDAPVAAPTLARRILDDTAAPSPSLKAVSPPSVNLSAGAPAALQDVDTGTPLAFKIGRGGEGSRRVTIGLAQYGGDWDSARHAMTFLGYQLGERTRLAIHGSDRVVSFSSPELAQLPFVYMTGHKDFSFSEAEVANLRAYLKGGGYLWADDSTNYRDETFDTAFRRELARILPDAPLVQLGMDFEGFKTGYDLTHGYKGYAIPPGDKYRLDYIEGARLGERVAVVYTRNDYGDGLNIDAHTHPLHESLTDLGPAEMQEGAIRMGLNLTLYFLTHGQGDAAFLDQTSTTLRQQREATTAVAPAGTPRALPIFAPPARWEHEAWSDDGTLTPAGEAARITFTVGAQQKCAFSLVPESPIAVTAQDVIALQVKSDLRCGARLALALTIEGRYFESRPIYVKPGENLALFPCGEATFKTEAGGWLYHDVLPLRADIQRFSLVIYSPAPGDMHLSTPKIIRVPAQ